MGNSVRKHQNASGSRSAHNSQGTVFYTDKNVHRSAQRTMSSSSIGALSDCSWATAQENSFDSTLQSLDNFEDFSDPSGNLSNLLDTTLQSLADLDNLENFSDPSGTLSNLLAQAGEDDFMKTVLSFCSYMEGRIDAVDNACLYDEFRLYASNKSCNSSLNNSLDMSVDLKQEKNRHVVF